MIQVPPLILDATEHESWTDWLLLTGEALKEEGYRKYTQDYKGEDFCYWKSFNIDGEKAYRIGILFYDFRKYKDRDPEADRIGIQYECMLLELDGRVDMSVSADMSLKAFEIMALNFYNSMYPYAKSL